VSRTHSPPTNHGGDDATELSRREFLTGSWITGDQERAARDESRSASSRAAEEHRSDESRSNDSSTGSISRQLQRLLAMLESPIQDT
jgi:hypothetical protein